MVTIGVDCRFEANGRLHIKRIKQHEQWVMVEQGRQWQDANGRHVLVMLPNQQTATLTLRPDTLLWQINLSGNQARAV